MNVFKKIMSTAVAMATLLTGMSFPVSATMVTILQGDVNNDNFVNVRDVAWMARYLKGTQSADSYNVTAADATKDGIIDYQDHNMILDNISNNPQTYARELYENLNDEERDYYKFGYSNKVPTGRSEYTLPASNTTTYSLSRATESIPDFVRDYSNTGVVRVGNGSGFIVDDHLVITAAHCVCGGTSSNPTAFADLEVTVYNDDETVSKKYTIDSIHVPQEYYGSDKDSYDYALIHIDDHYDNIPTRTFSQYEPYQIGYITNKFIDDERTIITSGYTTIPNSSQENNRYYSVGNVDSKSTNLRYHAQAGSNYGDSGGLAYYESKYNNEIIKSAIGNITGGGDGAGYMAWGVRITPTIARFIFNNENI